MKNETYSENYFWNTEEPRDKKVYCLIIYDIVNNKRRVKMAKKMSGYGFRVQKSAFEAMIKPSLYSKLVEELPKLIDEKEDSVRIYRIVGSGEVTMFGVKKQVENEDIIIV